MGDYTPVRVGGTKQKSVTKRNMQLASSDRIVATPPRTRLHRKMPSTAYMSAPAPINLTAKLGETKDETPSIDLHWEPFQAHIEAFLRAVSRRGVLAAQPHTSVPEHFSNLIPP